MSPRTLAASVLTLSSGLLLAVVMLATLSAEIDQSMVEEPPESFAGEMPGFSRAEPCEGTAPWTQFAQAPPEAAWLPQC
jgi:hypothetical protein